MSDIRIATQMFTIRDSIKTLDDANASLERLAKIGYRAVQISGTGKLEQNKLAPKCQELGIDVVSTHIGMDNLTDEKKLDELIESQHALKCNHTALGSAGFEYMRNRKGIDELIEKLAPAAGRLRDEGIEFGYHNHNQEMVRFDSKTWLELLIESAPDGLITPEIDTHWITAGGGDPAEFIGKFAGKVNVLHYKDMTVVFNDEGKKEVRFAPVGEGNLNWTAINQAAEAGGTKVVCVEQDNCYGADPFDMLEISFNNLRAMGLSA